jgi:hypothetical protein
VNVASRIEGVAGSNQVVVSEDVYRLIRNRPGYNPQPLGEHKLKGVDRPAPLFVLARPGEVVAAPAAAVGAAAAPKPSSASHRKAVAVGTLAGVTGFVLLSVFVAWTVNLEQDSDATTLPIEQSAATTPPSEPPASDERPAATADADAALAEPTAPSSPTSPATTDAPPVDAPPAQPTATSPDPAPAAATPVAAQTTDAAPSNRLLVVVFGEPPAGTAEAQILRSLGAVSGVTAMDASAAALLRRDPDAVRGALQGDFAALTEMARQQNIEYIVLGDFESSATQAGRGRMYTGTAQLGLRMYRVSTGEIIDSGVFGAGTGRDPAVAGATELGVRTQAAQDVGRQGAIAARRWLATALRD